MMPRAGAPPQRGELARLLRQPLSAAARDRVHALRELERGVPAATLATELQIPLQRVRAWQRSYTLRGTAGIIAAHPPAKDEALRAPITIAALQHAYHTNSAEAAAVLQTAASFFSQTADRHRLSKRSLQLLQHGASLHNLEARPAASALAIQTHPLTILSATMQRNVAALVRAQRGSFGKVQRRLQALTGTTAAQLTEQLWLAALLRIAARLPAACRTSAAMHLTDEPAPGVVLEFGGAQLLAGVAALRREIKFFTACTGQALQLSLRLPPALRALARAARKGLEPELLPNAPVSETARLILRQQLASLLHHSQNLARREDAEDVHQLRVSTRRLRAASALFAGSLDASAMKPFARALRTAGRVFGHVRDLDVLLEKLCSHHAQLPAPQQSGLDSLIAYFQHQQTAARVTALQYLHGIDHQAFVLEFGAFLMQPPPSASTWPHPVLACDAAPQLIYGRLAEVRAFLPHLQNASLSDLHDLRIDFKKLRYALDFFRPLLGAELKTVISALKQIQDVLGDLNDADVACAMVRRALDDDPGLQSQYWDINAYITVRETERTALQAAFPAVCAGQFATAAFQQQLASAVAAR